MPQQTKTLLAKYFTFRSWSSNADASHCLVSCSWLFCRDWERQQAQQPVLLVQLLPVILPTRHACLWEHLWTPNLCRSRVSKKHTSKVQNFSLLHLKTRVSHRHPPHSCYKPRRLGLKNLWFHTLRAIVWEELLILLQPLLRSSLISKQTAKLSRFAHKEESFVQDIPAFHKRISQP